MTLAINRMLKFLNVVNTRINIFNLVLRIALRQYTDFRAASHSRSAYMRPFATYVARSVVFQFVRHTVELCKMAKLIEMLFGPSSCVPNKPCIRWGPDLPPEWALVSAYSITYLWMTALRVVRLPCSALRRRVQSLP